MGTVLIYEYDFPGTGAAEVRHDAERQREGIVAAKTRGKNLGRPVTWYDTFMLSTVEPPGLSKLRV